MSTQINKENSIAILINSVRMGQKMGAYLLKETKVLKQAIDYFNPDVTDKPTFESAENPEIVAVNLLLQGVQKAQNHGGEFAYSIDDAALLWDILEFWIKEGGRAVTQNVKGAGSSKDSNGSAKSAVNAANRKKTLVSSENEVHRDKDEDEDEEDYNEIAPISYHKKGKERL
jgi:hypothetical protein